MKIEFNNIIVNIITFNIMLSRTPVRNPEKSSTKQGLIYKITSPKGKNYIGQTTKSFEHRWQAHISGARCNKGKCRVFENAINKCGVDNFKTETLLITSEDLLDFYERMFIETYNSLAPNGYNLREGGNGICTKYMREQMRIGNNKKLAKKSWPYKQHPCIKYVY